MDDIDIGSGEYSHEGRQKPRPVDFTVGARRPYLLSPHRNARRSSATPPPLSPEERERRVLLYQALAEALLPLFPKR